VRVSMMNRCAKAVELDWLVVCLFVCLRYSLQVYQGIYIGWPYRDILRSCPSQPHRGYSTILRAVTRAHHRVVGASAQGAFRA